MDVDSYRGVLFEPFVYPRNDNIIDLASRERPGRRQLVEQLFDRHAKALRLFLLGWSVPQEEIEDLVQELFTRLMGVDRLEERCLIRPVAVVRIY